MSAKTVKKHLTIADTKGAVTLGDAFCGATV